MTMSLDLLDPALRDVDFNAAKLPDVLEKIEQVRAGGRVVTPVRFHDEVAWMVVGHDTVASVLMNDTELPAADFYDRLARPWWGRTIGTVYGEEHRAYRAFFIAPLLPTCMRRYTEKALRPIADELVDGFSGRRQIDFLSEYARPYPFRVITRLFGLPDSDDPMIQKLVFELNHFPWEPEMATRARDAMTEYLRPIALARRRAPGDDLISYFATAEVDGELLNETDLVDCIRFLYPAAGENTANALCLLVHSVLKDPAALSRLQKDPDARQAAVEEALRITSPVSFILRYARRPVTIADTTIPAESLIILALGGANHDSAVFEDPFSFRLDRGANRHLAFGRGAHLCAGVHLAKAEMRMTLDVLLERLPGLKLADPAAIAFYGGIMRSPASLPLAFTDVLPRH